MRLAIALGLMMLLSVDVGAQRPSSPARPETGSLIPGHSSSAPVTRYGYSDAADASMDALSDQKALQVARKFAACVVRSDQSGVRAFVLASSEGIKSAGNRLSHVMDLCLSGNVNTYSQMRFGGHELQGFFSEAWLRKTMPVFTVLSPAPSQYSRPWVSADPVRAALDQTAISVAETQPDRARAVVLSEPDTPGEADAIAASVPALKACIDPKAAFRAKRMAIRLALATALFHRAYEADQAGATPSKMEKN